MSVLPRDPTQAMLDAARDWSVEQFHRGIGNKAATGCWQAMYDAAKPDLVRQAILTKVTNDAENAIVDWCVRIIEECRAEAGRVYGSEATISADKAIRRIREEMETSKFVAAASERAS